MIETFGGGDPQGGVFSFTTASTFNSPELSDGQVVLEKKFGDWDEKTENLGKNLPHLSMCAGVHLTTSEKVGFVAAKYRGLMFFYDSL